MYYKCRKRDLTKSVKVNSTLLKKFEDIVESKTRRWDWCGRTHYDCVFSGQGLSSGKYTIADLLEKALIEFIDTNSIQK